MHTYTFSYTYIYTTDPCSGIQELDFQPNRISTPRIIRGPRKRMVIDVVSFVISRIPCVLQFKGIDINKPTIHFGHPYLFTESEFRVNEQWHAMTMLLNAKLRFISQGFSTSLNNISISILSASSSPSMMYYI